MILKKLLSVLQAVLASSACLLLAVSNNASAQDPQIRAGTRTGVVGVRIAAPEFQASGDAKAAALTTLFNKVLWDDLEYSGVLTLVSRSFYPLGAFSKPADIKIQDWTSAAVDAQFIAFGETRVQGNDLVVEARLWDLKASQNREAIGQRYRGSGATEEAARLYAHTLADKIVELIGGGIRGIATSKIAYVTERSRGVKEVYVMDYDGANARPLTSFNSLALTPSWSPDGEKVAFTSYRRGSADIEVISAIDRKIYPFQPAGGTTTTPSWSPDGSKIAFATSRDNNDGTEIYVADWNGRNLRRLTVSKGVDISPTWNPKTGRELAFVSDRAGSAQIYIMDAEGTNVRRLIDGGGAAVNPAWSPDGQRIAFAWQRERGFFDIYIHDLATGRNIQLTQSQGNNERPTWAPDGRHIAFESNRQGPTEIYTMLADGTKVRQLTRTGKNQGPAWSNYAPN